VSPPDVRSRLAALVASQAHPPSTADTITDDTALLGGGLDLDSLSLLDLVVSIEEQFDVKVAAADVTPEHFGTFGALAAYVGARVESTEEQRRD